MAKIKKVRKYREGGDTEDTRCKIDKQGRRSCGPVGQGSSALSGKTPRLSKKEEAEADKQFRVSQMLKTSGKRTEPQSTVPGVRGVKKGSQYFFGRDKYESEAKYGKKVMKKAVVKKQSKKK
jgi:hypothetical protein